MAMPNYTGRAQDLADQNAQFYKGQFENIFGSTLNNLKNYYETMSPERVATLGMQAQQEKFQAAKKRVEDSLAARGLTGGVYEDYILNQAEFQNARTQAMIEASAPEMVAQARMQFANSPMSQSMLQQAGASDRQRVQVAMQRAQMQFNWDQNWLSAGLGLASTVGGLALGGIAGGIGSGLAALGAGIGSAAGAAGAANQGQTPLMGGDDVGGSMSPSGMYGAFPGVDTRNPSMYAASLSPHYFGYNPSIGQVPNLQGIPSTPAATSPPLSPATTVLGNNPGAVSGFPFGLDAVSGGSPQGGQRQPWMDVPSAHAREQARFQQAASRTRADILRARERAGGW